MQNVTLPSFFYDDTEKDRDLEVFLTYWISWTIRYAEDKYNEILRGYPKKILLKMLKIDANSHVEIKSVKTWKEWSNARIDLCVEVKLLLNGQPQEYAIAIELKMYSTLKPDQLWYHKRDFKNYYENHTDFKLVYIYLSGLDDISNTDLLECKKEDNKFDVFTICELKQAFGDNPQPTGNTLFDEFWFNYYGCGVNG